MSRLSTKQRKARRRSRPTVFPYLVEDYGNAQRQALFMNERDARQFFERAPLAQESSRNLLQGRYIKGSYGLVIGNGQDRLLESACGAEDD